MGTAYEILIKNSEGKRLLERPRYRWEDIKMYLQEIGCVLDLCSSSEWNQCRLS
jgi:hypothetical protein